MTNHWTHVTERCNIKPLQPPPLDEHGHSLWDAQCRNISVVLTCSVLTSPYRSCALIVASCITMVLMQVLVWVIVVVVVVVCCCCIPLQLFALMLVQMFAPSPCAVSTGANTYLCSFHTYLVVVVVCRCMLHLQLSPLLCTYLHCLFQSTGVNIYYTRSISTCVNTA